MLDNGEPQKVIAFRTPKSISANSDDSLSVILLVDTLKLPSDLAALERQQAAQFLRQNLGKLARSVTIYSLEDSGFFLLSKSSTDGEALAENVLSDSKAEAYFLAPHAKSAFKTAPIDISVERFPALAQLRALWTIATQEVTQPGRKLILWIGPVQSDLGPGAFAFDVKWWLDHRRVSAEDVKRDLFQKICWLSMLLRQARVTLDCFSIDNDEPVADTSAQLLVGIPSAQQASWTSPFKEIVAVQSGGHVLSSSGVLVPQINNSIEKARISYSLTFDPPVAAHADEYHSLKVELSKPILTAHTSTGYYDQPLYSDPPDPAIQHLTVAQLEEMLQATHSDKSLERQLSGVALSDRLSQAKLQPLLAGLHHKKVRESLEMVADESTFLDPPSVSISVNPPPDKAEQQRILTATADYLSRVIPRLPDFFADRTAISYRESVPYPGLNEMAVPEPLHPERQSKDTVLYRKGEEILSSASSPISIDPQSLRTYGTFGPILSLVQAALKSPDDVTWERWENDTEGTRAIFRYRVAGNRILDLTGCCFPNGDKDARIEFSSDSHGELVIDPGTGALLRVQTESELSDFVPTKRSDMMVSYGPVEIGGKTYVVPLRSVNIWRARSVMTVAQWNLDFATWGPYETQMNVFTFSGYHMFRGNARILPGFDQIREKPPTVPH